MAKGNPKKQKGRIDWLRGLAGLLKIFILQK